MSAKIMHHRRDLQKNLRIRLTMHYLVYSLMQFPEFIVIHIHFSRILT